MVGKSFESVEATVKLKPAIKRGLVTVAAKPSADIPRGTLIRILKQAQLKVEKA